jgi:hypothetical protein
MGQLGRFIEIEGQYVAEWDRHEPIQNVVEPSRQRPEFIMNELAERGWTQEVSQQPRKMKWVSMILRQAIDIYVVSCISNSGRKRVD